MNTYASILLWDVPGFLENTTLINQDLVLKRRQGLNDIVHFLFGIKGGKRKP